MSKPKFENELDKFPENMPTNDPALDVFSPATRVQVDQPIVNYRVVRVTLAAGAQTTIDLIGGRYVMVESPTVNVDFDFGGFVSSGTKRTALAGTARRANVVNTKIAVQNTGSVTGDVIVIEHDDPAVM